MIIEGNQPFVLLLTRSIINSPHDSGRALDCHSVSVPLSPPSLHILNVASLAGRERDFYRSSTRRKGSWGTPCLVFTPSLAPYETLICILTLSISHYRPRQTSRLFSRISSCLILENAFAEHQILLVIDC